MRRSTRCGRATASRGPALGCRCAGGVERVYCGHTPTRTTIRIENVHYIDTGAVYVLEGYAAARLTMVQIHPEQHREYAIRTAEPV